MPEEPGAAAEAVFPHADEVDLEALFVAYLEALFDPEAPGACGVRDAVAELEEQLGCTLEEAVRTNTDLIAAEAFPAFVRELAEDDAMFEAGHRWPLSCVDWHAAAEQLRRDHGYGLVEVAGRRYWSARWDSGAGA